MWKKLKSQFQCGRIYIFFRTFGSPRLCNLAAVLYENLRWFSVKSVHAHKTTSYHAQSTVTKPVQLPDRPKPFFGLDFSVDGCPIIWVCLVLCIVATMIRSWAVAVLDVSMCRVHCMESLSSPAQSEEVACICWRWHSHTCCRQDVTLRHERSRSEEVGDADSCRCRAFHSLEHPRLPRQLAARADATAGRTWGCIHKLAQNLSQAKSKPKISNITINTTQYSETAFSLHVILSYLHRFQWFRLDHRPDLVWIGCHLVVRSLLGPYWRT